MVKKPTVGRANIFAHHIISVMVIIDISIFNGQGAIELGAIVVIRSKQVGIAHKAKVHSNSLSVQQLQQH